MKIATRAKKINEKIAFICKDRSQVIAEYNSRDDSVQAELRLSADWTVRFLVDHIHYPKNLAGVADPLWSEMANINYDINRAAGLVSSDSRATFPINDRTKAGPDLRDEARAAWQVETGQKFLKDYKTATGKRSVAKVRKTITGLQARQKKLLPELRRSNSKYLAKRKAEKAEIAAQNSAALASGQFWNATTDALKDYFTPPFDKNYLADVSEKWRAALFLECQSISYKTSYGNWGHKLGGTGRGYLCGIDDNGDEWGHVINDIAQTIDGYGDYVLDSTVEDAMSELFGISVAKISDCYRQGDLLFCPAKIPSGTEIYPEPHGWEIMESHKINAVGLHRNGQYIEAPMPITVIHTSHEALQLRPGSYRLYTLQVAGAD